MDKSMKAMYRLFLCSLVLMLASCATLRQPVCPVDTLQLPGCPPVTAVDDPQINRLYDSRTWRPPDELPIDPVTYGEQAQVPINHARAKLLGPSYDDSLTSLAAKIWLIEHAQHTIDLIYYIFKPDRVGLAVLGALCDAVQRGVDIRVMVDSLGSFSFVHSELKALGTCAADAGFMRNLDGQITTRRARVQVVIFNSVSRFHFNRRSHDKLLVVDGHIPDKAVVITGGRNISLDYYGLREDGSEDPTAFRDLEILLRPQSQGEVEANTVGSVSEIYYTLLFFYKGNKLLWSADDAGRSSADHGGYERKRRKARESLSFLKSQPHLRARMGDMARFMSENFHDAPVRIAHQLNNLTSTEVTTNVEENLLSNPNSINYLIHKILSESASGDDFHGTLRIISPYLFASKYYDKEGRLVHDAARDLLDFLARNPNAKVEIITNSVMTSDNFFAQAIIDMDMAPRLLLTEELQKQWLSGLKEGERNPAVVEGDVWKRLIENPQVAIYQTGRLDSVLLGHGEAHYGKLHAKCIFGESAGFIGTSNFDYRSMLYNNEMGFFFSDPGLREDLLAIFEWLKATSYRWGSPEWLEMRRQVMEGRSPKASPARKQRVIFKSMKGLGVEYLM